MYKQYKIHDLPFATLELGESFEITDAYDVPYIRCQAVAKAKKLDRKFSVSQKTMKVTRTK